MSFITISYNSKATIERTIQSVLAQKNADIEYIVVDGASNDGTVQLIQQYEANISSWISEPDKGIYDAMNKGIELATGELIGLLNADDYFADDNVLSTIIAAFQQNNCDAAYADLCYKKGKKVVRYWKSGRYKLNDFKLGWMPPHPTFYLRRLCYKKYGFYRTDMRSAADYELMLRMLYKNELKTCYIPKVLVNMEVGGVSNASFKNRVQANREDQKAWEVNGLNMPWYTPILKPLRKLPQWIWKRT